MTNIKETKETEIRRMALNDPCLYRSIRMADKEGLPFVEALMTYTIWASDNIKRLNSEALDRALNNGL